MSGRIAVVVLTTLLTLGVFPHLTAGAQEADPPPEDRFEQITLARGQTQVGEAIALAVLPDGRVLHTARDGRVFLSEEGVGTSVAARIPVYLHDEEGLQGITIAPDFAESRWVYVMYAPHLDTPADDPATPGVNEGNAPADGRAPRPQPVLRRAAHRSQHQRPARQDPAHPPRG